MVTPNPYMFIIYVSDAPASARFYGDLLDLTPSFESPRFIAFELPGGPQLALWSGNDITTWPQTRTSELCLCLGTTTQIEERYEDWRSKGVHIVMEPHDAVFGRTFVAADPDGNLLRIAPVD
ncbi:MAG: VOC family protein [Mycobacteriaceae bacterium]|uniref:VOC family protein n=1 Tax=Corynebacterium sp. TaxID=1720 RepID=UPI003F9AFC5E